MTEHQKPDQEETARIIAAMSMPASPPPQGRGRRWLLGAAVVSVAAAGVAGAAFLWPEPEPVPQRLGPRVLVPPLLRATVGGDDRIFALVRRSEQDETDPPGTAAPRDRIELLAFAADGLAPRLEVHLASVQRGAIADAALIAEQGATIWLWLGGLGALSAVDGQVLADGDGLAQLNAEIAEALASGRRTFRLADALVVEAGAPTRGWRIDPRDFRASPADGPPARPLPRLHPAALHGSGGPTAFRIAEARLEATWFGLPAESTKLVPPLAPMVQGRFLTAATLPPGMRQALWRGQVRVTSAAPSSAPPALMQRWGVGERVTDLATVPAAAGLALAGFLTAGTEAPLQMAGPPGLLLLHGEAGRRLSLMRLGPEGQPLWHAELPILRLRSVLPGARHLTLVGWGATDAEEEVLSVALDSGAHARRAVSA
ncbi:hypothetical protein [Neoroseomonas soli]|uniref:Uncharacterized protein n=1 Tax=Neoroseomonas soli TaxID=1081025 RepID=A0A9X9X2C6_9PROT|nr:hypothetical protein [Neoroseomonas soli]MBR0673555.1 hypothetical protein [Neoroseomonas soli]